MPGQTVESLCSALPPQPHEAGASASADASANGNGNGHPSGGNGSGHAPAAGQGVQYLHTLRRCDVAGCQELVRARTTWKKQA